MSQASKEIFHALGQHAGVVGHLDKYLEALEPEAEFEFRIAAEAALFDESRKATALAAFGRLEMVKRLRKQLEPYVLQHTQQYTR